MDLMNWMSNIKSIMAGSRMDQIFVKGLEDVIKLHTSMGNPYGHPCHEVASLRIFGSRKSWAQRWNGLDE
jgi:hypothetical protein